MAGQSQIVALNMTNFFNRELMMYSFGDIKFKKPISLKAIAFTIGFLIVWTLPLFLVFGIPMDPFKLVVYLVPPIALGQLAIRPIFGGKTMLDFGKTAVQFIGEPKGWADGKPFNSKDQLYTTEHEIWISRRREYALLADMLEEEHGEQVAEAKLEKAAAKTAKKTKTKSNSKLKS